MEQNNSDSLLNEILCAYVDELLTGDADLEAYVRDHRHLADQFVPLAQTAETVWWSVKGDAPSAAAKERSKAVMLQEWDRLNREQTLGYRLRHFFGDKP